MQAVKMTARQQNRCVILLLGWRLFTSLLLCAERLWWLTVLSWCCSQCGDCVGRDCRPLIGDWAMVFAFFGSNEVGESGNISYVHVTKVTGNKSYYRATIDRGTR